MKPHSITLTAMGPFPGKQKVDFDMYEDIFLIAGPTGSGKTTIFDGIMFALYGVIPGTRDPKNVVSTYDHKDLDPSVELIFSIGSTKYKVFRKPAFMRPSKRGGDKLIEEAPAVELYELKKGKWNPVTGKITDLNDKIKSMLHLTADEFSRIVMLPQGEFQKFLVADTNEKRLLLEKIFPTEIHEKISVVVKERAREKQNELEYNKKEQEKMRGHFDPHTYDENYKKKIKEFSDRDKKYKKGKEELTKLIEDLIRSEEIEKLFAEYCEIKEKLDLLNRRGDEITEKEKKLKLAKNVREIKPYIDLNRERKEEINIFKEKKSNLENDLTEEIKVFEQAKIESKKISVIENEVYALNSKLGILENLLPKEMEHKKKADELKKVEVDFNSTEKNLLKFDESVKKINEEIKTLLIEIRKDERFNDEHSSLHKELSQINEICKLIENIEKLKIRIDESRNKIKGLSVEIKFHEDDIITLNKNKEKLNALKNASRAADLAKSLESGKPCPVCGSKEHPDPGTGHESFNDEKILNKIIDDISKNSTTVATLEERKKNNETGIKDLEKEIAAFEKNINMSREDALKKQDVLKKRIDELEKIKGELAEKRKRLDTLDEKKNRETELKDKLNSRIKELESTKSGLGAEVKMLSSELKGHENILSEKEKIEVDTKNKKDIILKINQNWKDSELKVEGLKKSIESLISNIKDLNVKLKDSENDLSVKLKKFNFKDDDEALSCFIKESELKNLEAQINLYHNEKKFSEREISTLEKKIKGRKRPEIKKLINERKEKEAAIDNLEKEKNDAENILNELKKNKSAFDNLTDIINRLHEESLTLIQLSNDLNGKNSKNINFQNFILGAYFRLVMKHASKRFNIMSDGRYRLEINEEITHGGRQAGLDIDVFDFYTGRERSVRSLSGGEKFLASISLALGLADVIQSRSGGIELDAIFIDEGFGSLDDAALNRALTILDDIRGNRLIGIISHVSELKTRIPGQVRVIKDSTGSRIEQVN